MLFKNLFKRRKKEMADLDKMLASLSEEEKKDLKAKLEDLYKAEDEREIDKIEEEKADNSEDKDEKREEVNEESEEIGKDVDELEDKIEDVENDVHEEAEEKAEGVQDNRLGNLEKKVDDILKMLASKGSSVEEKADEVYGIGSGVFQGDEKAVETKNVSAQDVAKLLQKIKR